MTPDLCADYNQIDGDGHVAAYLEDIVHSERVVIGCAVVAADPEAKAHTAVVAGISATGVVALGVDWTSQPAAGRATSATA